MGAKGSKSWIDTMIAYTPIVALFVVWAANPAKAANIGNPWIWVIGLTTLPSLAVIVAAFFAVGRRRRAEEVSGR